MPYRTLSCYCTSKNPTLHAFKVLHDGNLFVMDDVLRRFRRQQCLVGPEECIPNGFSPVLCRLLTGTVDNFLEA